MVTGRKEPCQAYMLHYLMFRLSRGQLIFMCWSTFACTEHVLRMAFIENWRARRFYSWCDWSCAPRHDFRAPSSCKAPWKAQHMEKRQPWNPKWSCSSSGSWDKPSESLRDPLPDLQIRSGLSAMLPHPACPQLHPPHLYLSTYHHSNDVLWMRGRGGLRGMSVPFTGLKAAWQAVLLCIPTPRPPAQWRQVDAHNTLSAEVSETSCNFFKP